MKTLHTLCAVMLTLVAATGCGPAGDDDSTTDVLRIDGEVAFELETLPTRAAALVTLRAEGTGAAVIEHEVPVTGQSGSEPFSMTVPRDRLAPQTTYHVQVEVQAEGRTLATSEPRTLNVSADSVDVGVISVAQAAAAAADTPPPGTFTARGHEPGWLLDIGPERLELEAYYGETRVAGPAPLAEATADGTLYSLRADDHDLTVTVLPRYCSDAMTGLPYPSTVLVILNGDTLEGCGGDPQELLAGSRWIVDSVDNRPVEQAHITLNFAADGTLSGSGGCNDYGGRYHLHAEGVSVADVVRTQMACEPGVDSEEQEYLDVLNDVRHFHLDDAGRLHLETDGGRTVTAAPA